MRNSKCSRNWMQTYPVSPVPRADHRLPTAEEVTIEGLRALQRAVCRGGLVVDLRWADAKADDGELVSESRFPRAWLQSGCRPDLPPPRTPPPRHPQASGQPRDRRGHAARSARPTPGWGSDLAADASPWQIVGATDQWTASGRGHVARRDSGGHPGPCHRGGFGLLASIISPQLNEVDGRCPCVGPSRNRARLLLSFGAALRRSELTRSSRPISSVAGGGPACGPTTGQTSRKRSRRAASTSLSVGCGSVRSPAAATRASRRSSLAGPAPASWGRGV